MPKKCPNKKQQVFLCGCPLKKCRDARDRHDAEDYEGVFVSHQTAVRHIARAVRFKNLRHSDHDYASFWKWKEDFESADWYERQNLVYYDTRFAAGNVAPDEELGTDVLKEEDSNSSDEELAVK